VIGFRHGGGDGGLASNGDGGLARYYRTSTAPTRTIDLDFTQS